MSSLTPSFSVDALSHSEAVASSLCWNPRLRERVERALAGSGVRSTNGVYSPLAALFAWLWQVLHQESCVAAVMWWTGGGETSRLDTGTYCRARSRLPESLLRQVTSETASSSELSAAESWRWHGRGVFLVDGTTVSMPDTSKNQAAYPQPKAQKPGVGFPLLRVVLVVSLATGMVWDAVFGPYSGKESGETSLLRRLLGLIPQGSILLADRYYCSYWTVALAIHHGLDVVLRQHQRRNHDFRQGRSLGPGDRRVVWTRPRRPAWMSLQEYQSIPPTLTLRLLRTKVNRPGWRVRELVVLTTLEPAVYSVDDIVSLYGKRWNVELDIRSIKSTMRMEILRCKSPENVRREIWIHLLAYNLCREYGVRSARATKQTPRAISLKACLSALKIDSNAGPSPLNPGRRQDGDADWFVRPLGGVRVGCRPGRFEPRAAKRRPKPHKLLCLPRHLVRARLLQESRSP